MLVEFKLTRYSSSLASLLFLLLLSANAQAESQQCDGVENDFVDDGFYNKELVYKFAFRRNLLELTNLSNNDGSSGFKTDNLEGIYLELLARIEFSRFLGEEVRTQTDGKGKQIRVRKIPQNPFAVSFNQTYICQYEIPEPTLLFVGTIKK